MTDSLLLDQTVWDLCLDASRNIAVASAPYALAQDAANAIRLFAGEAWYDTTKGVPYFGQILGRFPPLPLVKAQLVKAALTVPGIVAAECSIATFVDRNLSGQVRITDDTGVSLSVAFTGDATSGLTTSIGT